MAQVGISAGAMGLGRFGVTPPNTGAPSGSNSVDAGAAGEVPWYASGPVWVVVFLVVGYLLTRQTLRG